MASAEEKGQRLEDAPTGLHEARPEQQFSIVCLSSQRWDTALRTNRQQVMLRAARRGHRVLFVETGHFRRLFVTQKVRLAGLPNVRWLGQKPYAELPRYLAAFDAAAD